VSRTHLQTILRRVGTLAADPTAPPDAELLARFVASRDDGAFETIVGRHGSMVWSVCRNLLPGDADTEDAFQATFLALVRGGPRIRDGNRLASWLHGTALRIATKLRRTAARRLVRETAAATDEADRPIAESAWSDLLAAVHEEVDRLPDSLRSAFVLCGLEGARGTDAAVRLGVSPNTLAARLARARQRVLDNLSRRGIALGAATAAVSAATVTGHAAVPASIAGPVIALARSTESVSPTVLFLAQGALTMGFRAKWLAAALLVAGALTTTVGTVFFATATGQFPGGGGRGGDGGGRGGGAGSPNSPSALAARMAPQWEYKLAKIALLTADAEKELNKLGDDGWELTLSNEVGGIPVQVFKRPKSRAFPFAQTGGAGSSGGAGGDGGTGTVAAEKKSESTHVIPIQHAKATTLAATIAPLLGSEESSNRSPFGGGGFNPGARRTSTGRLSIAVDDRTNSIIVISDDATLKTIKELVEKLDVAVKDEAKPSK
jgi:RNA polymerase sigma factor (sigma-70 family)